MKKIFVILAILVALVAIFTISASAKTYSGNCGTNVGWSLDTDTGVLTISGTGAMQNYPYYSYVPWYSDCSFIKTISIGNSITSIGTYAFQNCTGLTSISIPDSITSIGNGAFYGCTSLTSITIPDSVTSIGSSAFYNTAYYNDEANWAENVLYIGNHLIDAKTSISGTYSIKDNTICIANNAFYNCTELKSIIIPNSVTSIGDSAFSDCRGLITITIGNSVTHIGNNSFSSCSGLTSITIPDSVTFIAKNAFSGCNGVESIAVGTNNSSYYSWGNCIIEASSNELIFGCKNTLIPDSVTSIGDFAFRYCTGLTSISIPDSITSIGDGAFYGCTELTVVYISDIAKWCNISFTSSSSNPLSYAKNLYLNGNLVTNLNIPNNITSIGSYAFSDCTGLTSITIPNSVTSIGSYAFRGCTGLTSITIPNSVTSIGSYAFRGCTGLTSIAIGNKVTYMGDFAFSDCTGLTSVTIENGVTSIGTAAFFGCTGLISINIPNSVTAIGSAAFYNCTGLASITIPESVTSIGDGAFSFCDALIDVNISDIATWCNISFTGHNSNPLHYAKNLYLKGNLVTNLNIPNSVTFIGNYAFSGCKGLKSVTISDSVTSIGNYAFYGCEELTSTTIGNSVTSICDRAFQGCTRLTSITIPNSVTFIGYKTFNNCKGLTSVTISNSVTSIGDYAFNNCTKLKSIYNASALTLTRRDTSNGYAAYYADTVINARLRSAAPGLGADLSLTVYADISATIDTVDIPAADVPQYVKLRVTMNGKTTDLVGTLVSGNQYSFKFKGIAPQCIGDEIDLALVYNDGEKDVIIDTIEDYSIVQYCQKLTTLTAAQLGTTQAKFDQLKTLIADLVAYSTAAQDYINYKVDAKPTVSGATPSTFVPLTGGDTSKTATTVPGLNFKAATLYFYSTNVLQFDFEATDITGVTVKINGKESAFTCIDPANNLYRVETDDIYAIEFEDVYTIELLKNGEVAQTLTYSVKSYVYSKQGKTDGSGNPTAMAILAQRTWNYGQSAKAYAAK